MISATDGDQAAALENLEHAVSSWGRGQRRRRRRSDRRQDYGEERYVNIAEVEQASIVVAHTRRDGRTRLISARPASRKERQAYHEYREEV